MLAFIINLLLVTLAYLQRKLTLFGALAALIIGYLYIGLGSWMAWFILILFFGSSIVIQWISHLLKLSPTQSSLTQKESENGRGAVQVVMNSILGLVCLILFHASGDINDYLLMAIAIAGPSADTWGSEIGILSSKSPHYLIGFKAVPRGLSGGVSKLGLLASLLGASYIALVTWMTTFFSLSLFQVSVIIFWGFLCSIIDSILGQFIQAIYQDPRSGDFYEYAHPNAKLIQGFPFVTNSAVNLLSNLVTLILAYLVLH